MGLSAYSGALQNLGHEVAHGTVANILRRHEIDSAPERKRKTTWKEFLAQHWDQIAAADFFTMEVWTPRGLPRFLIHDRDPLFTSEFLGLLEEAGIQSVKLSPRSPNLNAHAERFVRTIKASYLDRTIFFSEAALRHSVRAHYHLERNHQGLGNRLITPIDTAQATGPVQCRQRLGGMLNYYYRNAA